jgi:hypothetical protein
MGRKRRPCAGARGQPLAGAPAASLPALQPAGARCGGRDNHRLALDKATSGEPATRPAGQRRPWCRRLVRAIGISTRIGQRHAAAARMR